MPSTPLPFLLSGAYALSLWSLCFASLFAARRQVRVAMGFIWAVTVLSGLSVLLIIICEHRLPLFGPFESGIYIILLSMLMEIVSQRNHAAQDGEENGFQGGEHGAMNAIRCLTSVGTALFCLGLMGLMLPHPKAFNGDFFMYGSVWVNLFFNLRLVATAIWGRAAVMFLVGAWVKDFNLSSIGHAAFSESENRYKKRHDVRDLFFTRARNLLLMGLVIFLCSEWSGSWWCLNWLGDSWRWNQVFFKAAMVFILVMLACHLPPSLAKSSKIKAIFGALPMLFLLWIIFYH